MKLAYKGDPFFQFPRVSRKTSLGIVDFPIYYYDTSNVIAIFKADQLGVDKLLTNTGFKEAIFLNGSPLVFMSFYEYRHTSIGSYNEVGLAIPIIKNGVKQNYNSYLDLLRDVDKRQIGFYVTNLPVNTEEANAAGREFWGFPKFVTDIPFKLENKYFESEVKDPTGSSICKLGGDLKLGIKAPALSAITYSNLNGKTHRTAVNVRGDFKAYLAHKVRLRIGNSGHDMAENLRALKLNNSRPVCIMSSTTFQSRLNLGATI